MSAIAELQFSKLHRLLALIEAAPESFQARRLQEHGILHPASSIRDLAEFTSRFPFTTKDDLVADRLAFPPFGSNFTEARNRYTRFCQTSGTSTGQPMAVLDTPESWEAMLRCWRKVYEAAGIQPGVDRIFFAFSFGPFLGFWTAYEAAARDYLILPAGGLSSQARLEMMARYKATVLCCTPTYAMRLGEHVGTVSGIRLDQLAVQKIIVAGEPGGSLHGVRTRLQELWGGVEIFDHHGMTEVGPVSYEDRAHPGSLGVIEEAYFAEVLDEHSHEVADGAEGELVLTTLDRTASPLLRYRTGDLVRKKRARDGRLFLEGGILGRTDDMSVIRGVNIYPTAVENVVRQFPEVVEFVIEQRKIDAMEEIELVVELSIPSEGVLAQAQATTIRRRLEDRLRDVFDPRIPVRLAGQGELPRFEFKARRWKKV